MLVLSRHITELSHSAFKLALETAIGGSYGHCH